MKRILTFLAGLLLAAGAYAAPATTSRLGDVLAGLTNFSTVVTDPTTNSLPVVYGTNTYGIPVNFVLRGAATNTAMTYVDGTVGSDTTGARGRLDKPFKTIGAAFATVVSGDTVVVRSGTYSEAALVYTNDTDIIAHQLYLAFVSNVVVRGEGRPQVSATSFGNLVTLESVTNVVIEGIDFHGSTVGMAPTNFIAAAINRRGVNADITIQRCGFYNFPDQAISHIGYLSAREDYRDRILDNHFHNIGSTNWVYLDGTTNIDGSLYSGLQRDFVFARNTSSGLIAGAAVELDSAGTSAGTNVLGGVIAHNELRGLYSTAVALAGYEGNVLRNNQIVDNFFQSHATLVSPSSHWLILVTDSDGTLIQNNVLEGTDGTTGWGILLDPSAVGIRDVLISGNTFKRLRAGIYSQEVAFPRQDINVIGNNFFDTGYDPITFLGGKGITISGNYFGRNGTIAPGTRWGVRVQSTTSQAINNVSIVGNTFSDVSLTNLAYAVYADIEGGAANPTNVIIGPNSILSLSLANPYSIAAGYSLEGTDSQRLNVIRDLTAGQVDVATNLNVVGAANVGNVVATNGVTVPGTNGYVQLVDDDGAHHVTLQAPTDVTTNVNVIFPANTSSGFVYGTEGSATNWTLSAVGSTGSGSVVLATSPAFTTPADFTMTNLTVATEVYGAGWNNDNTVPTKDAVYDKIETLGGATSLNVNGTNVSGANLTNTATVTWAISDTNVTATAAGGTGSSNIVDNGYVAEINNATVKTNLVVSSGASLLEQYRMRSLIINDATGTVTWNAPPMSTRSYHRSIWQYTGGSAVTFGEDWTLVGTPTAADPTATLPAYCTIPLGSGDNQQSGISAAAFRTFWFGRKWYWSGWLGVTDTNVVRICAGVSRTTIGNLCSTNETVGGTAYDSAYFRYSDIGTPSGSAVNWCAITYDGVNAAQVTDTGVQIAESSPYKLEIFGDGSANIWFAINGTMVATNTTNIPIADAGQSVIVYRNGESVAGKTLWLSSIDGWSLKP